MRPEVHTAAIVGWARGNGKTTLVGAIGAAAVNGPLAQNNSEVLLVALCHFSRLRLRLSMSAHFCSLSIDANPRNWSVSDSAKIMRVSFTSLQVQAFALSPRMRRERMDALPVLVLADEPESMA